MKIRIQTPIPGPRSVEAMEARRREVARGPFHATPIFVRHAEGGMLEDLDGNRFLDFATGIGVANVGHRHPAVVEALAKQMPLAWHLSFNVTPYEGYTELCARLNRLTPGKFSKKSFLANSGAEAVENAVKIARVFTKKTHVVAFDHAFHGRTFFAMSLTAKEKPYRAGFHPLPGEVIRCPFPYPYRGVDTAEALRALERAVDDNRGKIAALIVEPVLGEGGFLPAPKEFLSVAQTLCRKEGIVFIADEIQSGFGRAGLFTASEALGLEPDLVCYAKGLGGGLPISAVTGRQEIMDAPEEGGIGGTFGGNPLSCAAAIAVTDLVASPNFLAHAREIGNVTAKRLARWKEIFPRVGDVRGLGALQAMELVRDRESREPDAAAAKRVVKAAYEKGVILMTAGSHGNVIRFLMPLTLPLSDLEEGLSVVENALSRSS